SLAVLAAAAREPNLVKRWEELQRVLDVDRFVSFMAMEILTTHTDGYCLNRNNYRIYRDPASAKFVFMPHGMDIMFTTPDLSVRPAMTGLVARAVMEIPQGRELYESRLTQLFTNLFQPDVLQGRIDALEKRLNPILLEQNPELARKHAIAVESLHLLISQRIRHVQSQLSTTGSIAFDVSGVIPLPAWKPDSGYGNHLVEILVETNKTWLHLRAASDAPCTASFRTNLTLMSGHYRLEGSARCVGVIPLQDDKGEGAGLRISGTTQPRLNKLIGDSALTPLIFEFEFENDEGAGEVELICELRATHGEAWFDLSSLKLSRK
ncbi:MAG TPA: CotH kinase family protein, partial [Verrucomicrobiae bacterium]|nr:CotH kinase family protein [Verrucomicrobiae bacterium]